MLGIERQAYSRHLGGRSRGDLELMARLNVQSKSNKGPPEQLSETHLKTSPQRLSDQRAAMSCRETSQGRLPTDQTQHLWRRCPHSTYWSSPQILSINPPTTFNTVRQPFSPPQHSLHLGSEQSSLLAQRLIQAELHLRLCIPTHKSAEHDNSMLMTNHACHCWPCGLQPDLTSYQPSLIQWK